MSLPQRHRSPEAGQGVPAPANDAIDALVEAVSAGGRPSPSATSDEFDRASRSVVTLPARARRSWIPSRMARWIAPALLAFAIGLGGAVWSLRSFESFAPRTDSVDVAPAPLTPAPVAPRAPAASLPVPSAPPPVDLLASNDLRPSARFPRAARPSLSARDLTAVRQTLATRERIAAAVVPPLADRPVGVRAPRGPERSAGATAPTIAPADMAADNAPIEAIGPAVAPSALPPIEASSPVSAASEERRAVAESTTGTTHTEAAEETAVLGAVEEYAQALEQLDVTATALLWPSVDRRALSRAFASLKSQEVMFDTCNVELAESTATARCHGTAHYVAKVGPSSPRTGRYEWLFKMRKRDDVWKIEALSAWPAASASRDQQ